MSMQILLREGFYILKHNLPLGNWTVGFFSFATTCSCTHEQAIPVRGWFLIQITKNMRRWFINIPVTLHGAIIEYGFESKMSQGRINLLC